MAWHTETYALDDPAARQRWAALWQAASLRSPFSHLAFVEASAVALGCQATFVFAAAEERDAAAALLPWKSRGPWRAPVVPAYTAYSALLLRTPPTDADAHNDRTPLRPLLAALREAFPGTALHLPPPLADVRPAQWHGWQAAPLYTYRAALPASGSVTEGWRGNARRRFNKAHQQYQVSETTDPAPVIAQIRASLQRQGRDLPCTEEQLMAWFTALQRVRLLRLFLAKDAGTPAGGMAVLVDRAEGYNWLVGSTPGPAMTVLMGAVLTQLREEGFRTYDWVGANTASVAEFKRSFGGTLTPYYRLTCPAPRPLRWLRTLQAYRR